MLLGAAERNHGAVVPLEVGLDLHPVHVPDAHEFAPSLAPPIRAAQEISVPTLQATNRAGRPGGTPRPATNDGR